MTTRTKKYLKAKAEKKLSDWCDRIAAQAEEDFIRSIEDMGFAAQQYFSTIYYDKKSF